MIHDFRELIFGGVLIAPVVPYLIGSFVIVLLLRPILHLVGFERIFANPPLALFGAYLTILAAVMLLV